MPLLAIVGSGSEFGMAIGCRIVDNVYHFGFWILDFEFNVMNAANRKTLAL